MKKLKVVQKHGKECLQTSKHWQEKLENKTDDLKIYSKKFKMKQSIFETSSISQFQKKIYNKVKITLNHMQKKNKTK